MNSDKAIAKVAMANRPVSITSLGHEPPPAASQGTKATKKEAGKSATNQTINGSLSSPVIGRRFDESAISTSDFMEPGVFVYNEKEFSFGGGAAATAIKQRLMKLMGTDVVRILDREYIIMLGARIQLQYEEELKLQEKRLADAEVARTFRLVSGEDSSEENGSS